MKGLKTRILSSNSDGKTKNPEDGPLSFKLKLKVESLSKSITQILKKIYHYLRLAKKRGKIRWLLKKSRLIKAINKRRLLSLLMVVFIFLFLKGIFFRGGGEELKFYQQYEKLVIEPEELMKKILSEKEKGKFVLIDLREKRDYQRCRFKGAINISVSEKDWLDKVKKIAVKGKEVIIYGRFGLDKETRDTVVNLIKKGIKAKPLSIGWYQWKYLYGRAIFEEGREDINRYLEPQGCLTIGSYFPGQIMPPGLPYSY